MYIFNFDDTCHNQKKLCGIEGTRRAHNPKIDGSKPSIAIVLSFCVTFPHPPDPLLFTSLTNCFATFSTKESSRVLFAFCHTRYFACWQISVRVEGLGDVSHPGSREKSGLPQAGPIFYVLECL